MGSARYKAKQCLCCLLGKDNEGEKKKKKVFFPAPLVELLQRFEGLLDPWMFLYLLLSTAGLSGETWLLVSDRWGAHSFWRCLWSAHSWRSRRLGLAGECPARSCAAFLAPCSAWLPMAKQLQCWEVRSCHSSCPWRALKRWTCIWPLPHRKTWEGSGRAAASRDRGWREAAVKQLTKSTFFAQMALWASAQSRPLPPKCCQPATQSLSPLWSLVGKWHVTGLATSSSVQTRGKLQASTIAVAPQLLPLFLLLPGRGSV